MKRTILTIAILSATLFSMAGGKQFQQKMGQTLAQYASCRTIEDYQALGNKFKIISNVEKEEWLPLYYHAHCYIIMSFMENNDKAKKDEYLDIAEESINKMIELMPQESEVFALQAFYYTARLVVDPMTRGQEYGALSGQSVGKALAFDTENPRARYMKISNEKGTAQFFGNDVKKYCKQAKYLLKKWDNYKIKSPIHPKWGKDFVVQISKSCN
jgi:hypothetical protein